MDLQETMLKHKEFWIRVSEANIDNFQIFSGLKKNYIEDTNTLNACYLCQFSLNGSSAYYCNICPCIENTDNGCLNGLYEEVVDAFDTRDKELFKKLATEIANLPVINPIYLKE
jgi:hypothetical protein